MSSHKPIKVFREHDPWTPAFVLSYIGAAIYFVQQADGFWEIVLALLKALVWIVFVVYELLRTLGV